MNRSFHSYCRVSTNRQGQSGLGLEAQQEAVRRYVEGVGGVLVAEHIEVESGKCSTRPILAEAIAACRRKRGVLVIAKLDRLSRSVAFTSALMESDVEFVACDMPAANRLMLHLMSAFAEHEAQMISERTIAALAAAKARGVVLGRHGRQLADDNRAAADGFAESLRGAVEPMLRRGNVRLLDVANRLNEAGYLTREGASWGPTAVHRILRRLGLRTPAMVLAEAA